MAMSVKVSYELSPLEKKFGEANVLNARRVLANQILLDSEKYIPSRDGYLKVSGSIAINARWVQWNTVYARAQFFGSNGIVTFSKYTTPGTGTKWTEKASKANMHNWENVAKKGLGIR